MERIETAGIPSPLLAEYAAIPIAFEVTSTLVGTGGRAGIAPAFRRRGVGRALSEAAETWALAKGCRELKRETQNINVQACRFYAAMGCGLRTVVENAYRQCPGEAQWLWYETLRGSRP
jgi:GNAT superfamily N-acetyltransferase